MRWFGFCVSGASRQAAARSPVSSPAITSPLKKSLIAAERKRDDVVRARRRWVREQGLLDPAHLIFIDETAVSTNMVRPNGWSPRGERLVGHVPMAHWKTMTFIAGFRQTGIVAPMVIKGAMNGEAFLAYIEQCLAPTLKRRDVMQWPARQIASQEMHVSHAISFHSRSRLSSTAQTQLPDVIGGRYRDGPGQNACEHKCHTDRHAIPPGPPWQRFCETNCTHGCASLLCWCANAMRRAMQHGFRSLYRPHVGGGIPGIRCRHAGKPFGKIC